MTQEWVYKATDTLASLKDTESLALNDGFLAKAAYVRGDKKARAAFVKTVTLGDIIHFYFKNRRDQYACVVGSFEVTDNKGRTSRFSWPTENTHLVTVIDPAFVQRLKGLGYEDDPQLGVMTGCARAGWLMALRAAWTMAIAPARGRASTMAIGEERGGRRRDGAPGGWQDQSKRARASATRVTTSRSTSFF